MICAPFKSGLFSFRHRPAYCTGPVDAAQLGSAPAYPSALEECRAANIAYYRYLTGKYGDL